MFYSIMKTKCVFVQIRRISDPENVVLSYTLFLRKFCSIVELTLHKEDKNVNKYMLGVNNPDYLFFLGIGGYQSIQCNVMTYLST